MRKGRTPCEIDGVRFSSLPHIALGRGATSRCRAAETRRAPVAARIHFRHRDLMQSGFLFLDPER